MMSSNKVKNFIIGKKRFQRGFPASVSALALAACGSSSEEDTVTTISTITPNITGDDDRNSLIGSADVNDVITGLGGDDYIRALAGDDVIYGGSGNDMIWADAGDDVIYGGEGNDTLRAGDGDDKSYGGAGNDIIYLSSGNDIEDGGDGNDTIKILSENSSIPITFDLLLGQYYYTAQLSSSLINLVSIENIESQASADTTVKDTPDANVIATGTGNDDIYSVGGDDIISTGAGDDAVTLTIGAYVVEMAVRAAILFQLEKLTVSKVSI
jgi:Ca2+-binding RTX toxin-like protein